MENRSQQEGNIPTGTETILLADDEDMILELGPAILEKYGYTVLTALDGEKALSVFAEERKQIDLIILDLSMPRFSGREALERIRQLDPDVKVLVSSGYSEKSETDQLEELGATGYVPKPYTPSNLARAVRNALDAGNPLA